MLVTSFEQWQQYFVKNKQLRLISGEHNLFYNGPGTFRTPSPAKVHSKQSKTNKAFQNQSLGTLLKVELVLPTLGVFLLFWFFDILHCFESLLFLDKAPLPPLWLLPGSPMLMDPHPIQQHVGLHHAVSQLEQEVTRPKARFKPISPKKSAADRIAIRCQHILVDRFICIPHCDLV